MAHVARHAAVLSLFRGASGLLRMASGVALSFALAACSGRGGGAGPQLAYVANADSNTASTYSIGANGVLTPVPGSPFAAGTKPYSVTVNPAGTFAYVANVGDGTISAYSICDDRRTHAGVGGCK